MLAEHFIRRGKRAVISAVAAGLSVFLVLSCSVSSAQAVTSSEVAAQAKAAYEAVQVLDEQYNLSSERYNAAVMQQDAAKKRIEDATAKIQKHQGTLSTRARSMYRDGSISVVDLLLGSASFEEFVTNWDLLDQMNENDAVTVQETKALREEVKAQEKILAEQTAIAKQEKETAAEMKQQMEETYNNLSAEAQALYEQERQAAIIAAYNQAMAAYGGDGWTGYTGTWEYDPSTGNDILARAYAWLGQGSYVYGACSEGQFDCSGFVSYCLSGQYSRLGNTNTFMGWNQISDPQPGCVCVNEGHTGIYIGNGQMIHAASEGEGVCIGPVQSGMIFVSY